MSSAYNVYCDESSIENVENPFLVIGALYMRRELRDEIKAKLNELKSKHGYRGEIKWTKTTSRVLPLYQEAVDLFAGYAAEDLQFHCIKIERATIDYKLYHHGDREEGFYKFYYQLFKNKFKDGCSYFIYLDYKPTKLKNRVFVLEYYLKYRASKFSDSVIRCVQAQHSKQSLFIQLADLLTGAVNYDNNQNEQKSAPKKQLVEHLAKAINKENLKFCSLPSESKFNIFCIDPGKNRKK
jgi:hypothetical protein